MNVKKEQKNAEKKLLRMISRSAAHYSDYLAGRDFLVLYNGQAKEFSFHARNFRHLCGVDSNLYATEFYSKALAKELTWSQIGFSKCHPQDMVEDRVKALFQLNEFLQHHLSVFQNVNTKTQSYDFALGNKDTAVMFNMDRENVSYVPQSLRIGKTENLRCGEKIPVDYILFKEGSQKIYDQIAQGDPERLADYLKKHNLFAHPIDIWQKEQYDIER